MFVRDIHFFDDLPGTVTNGDRVREMREGLLAGDVFIARGFMPRERILRIRQYLEGIARHSLPNYQRIEPSCPNFHRIDRWDPRAHVGACVHSFSFFPWNHDVLDLFTVFRPVYQLKNLLSGLAADSFLGVEPDRGCTARMSFQYYPRGLGGLNRHTDPFDYHQITVPSLWMSKKGEDFQQGGMYVEASASERVELDELCDIGDVVYFNAQTNHGVERIDPDATPDWLSFAGRWIGLFAVNKLFDNPAIGDSQDLDRA